MLHELWEDFENGKWSSYMLCLAGPLGEDARRSLSGDAVLTWTLEADSHIAAMQAYYRHQGWGEYSLTLDAEGQPYPPDVEPYPEHWVATQRSSGSG